MTAALEAIPWRVVVTAGVIAVFAYGIYRQRRRAAALRQRAVEMGFEFLGTPSSSARALAEVGPFALLRLGYSPSVRNLMRGARGGYDLTVFDYGARATPREACFWRTVVRIAAPSLRLPAFTVEWQSLVADSLRRPDSRLERLERHSLVAEVRDALASVEFARHPRFSRDYRVRGNDQAAIAAALGDTAVAFFEQRRGWNVESLGDRLIVDRAAFTVDAAQLEPFMDEVLQMVGVLEAKAS
jgi:hypothetical protein